MLYFTYLANLWLNFAVLIFVQFLVFLVHAYYEDKLADVPRVLRQGAITGLVVGPPCDLIFGQYLGLGTYLLGFGSLFIILVGVLGYGLMAANILLMQQVRLGHFLLWMSAIALVSEVLNLLLPSWTWPFPMLSIEYVVVGLLAPVVLAVIVALVWHILLGHRFVFINNAIGGEHTVTASM